MFFILLIEAEKNDVKMCNMSSVIKNGHTLDLLEAVCGIRIINVHHKHTKPRTKRGFNFFGQFYSFSRLYIFDMIICVHPPQHVWERNGFVYFHVLNANTQQLSSRSHFYFIQLSKALLTNTSLYSSVVISICLFI